MLMVAAIALTATAGNAVERRLAQIRQAYDARLAIMANKPFEDQPFDEMTVTFADNRAGMGLSESTMTYHFIGEAPADDTGEHPRVLYFVQGTLSHAMGSYNHYIELLYDAETGAPMFALVKLQFNDDASTEHSLRVYLGENGHIIKTVPADSGDFFRRVEQTAFATELTNLDAVLRLFDHHRAVFNTVMK